MILHKCIKKHRKHKCYHCKELYHTDYRNRYHQKYCSKPECQHASKHASQKRYLSSPKGRGYFKGPENVKRVQEWRTLHPFYWKRTGHRDHTALQDVCYSQFFKNQSDKNKLIQTPLQDICSLQLPLLIGLISNLTGHALQDDIVEASRRFINLGQDILGNPSPLQS
jgi:hypothetical protein